MTDITRPQYHRIAWRPTIVGTVTVEYGLNSAVVDLATDIGSTRWGWAENGSHVASPTESIQGRLAVLLETELDAWGVFGVSATYTWPDGDQGVPITRYAFITPADQVTITFSSAAVALQFGFDGAGPHTSTAGILDADFHDTGHWGPRVRGGWDEKWARNPNTALVEALDGSARKQWVWGATLYDRVLHWPTVYVADIRADAAATTSQATAAGRVIADTNATLEGLLEAARTPENTDDVRAFRIYTGAGVYAVAYLLTGIDDLQALCDDASVHRIYRVTMTWRAA